MDVTQYLLKKFVAEFNENVVCHFRQGYVDDDLGFDSGPFYAKMDTDDTVDKPNNQVYMSVNLIDGVTVNASIGTEVLKQDNIALVFKVFTPRNMSFSKDNAIQDALDPIFLNERFAEPSFEIQPDSATPKTKDLDLPNGDDGMFIRTITYRFEVRYF